MENMLVLLKSREILKAKKIKTARTPVAKSTTATPSSTRDTPMIGTPSREVEFGGIKSGGKKLNFSPGDGILTPLSSAKKREDP